MSSKVSPDSGSESAKSRENWALEADNDRVSRTLLSGQTWLLRAVYGSPGTGSGTQAWQESVLVAGLEWTVVSRDIYL